MRRFRFSMGRMLLVIGACAVGLAALRESSQLWASILFTVTLLGLAAALMAFRLGSPRRRAAAWGAIAVGGLYLGASVVPTAEEQLVTGRLLDWMQDRWFPQPTTVTSIAFSANGQQLALANSTGTVRLWSTTTGLPVAVPSSGVALTPRMALARWIGAGRGDTSSFRRIGHVFFAWLLAAIGAGTATMLAGREDRDRDRSTATGRAGPCDNSGSASAA